MHNAMLVTLKRCPVHLETVPVRQVADEVICLDVRGVGLPGSGYDRPHGFFRNKYIIAVYTWILFLVRYR